MYYVSAGSHAAAAKSSHTQLGRFAHRCARRRGVSSQVHVCRCTEASRQQELTTAVRRPYCHCRTTPQFYASVKRCHMELWWVDDTIIKRSAFNEWRGKAQIDGSITFLPSPRPSHNMLNEENHIYMYINQRYSTI